MWLAYSSALPNKASFWTGSTLVNIWVFALKLFVCDNAIIILNRAKVWPWDGRILTNFVIFIESEPSEDMEYHFSKLPVLISGSVLLCDDQNLYTPHFMLSPYHHSWSGSWSWVRETRKRQTAGRIADLCRLLPNPALPLMGLISVLELQLYFLLLHCQEIGKEQEVTATWLEP